MEADTKKAIEEYAKGPEMTIERANKYRIDLGMPPLTEEEYAEKIKYADRLNNIFEKHFNPTIMETNPTKKELQEQLNKINEQEEKDFIEEHYPFFKEKEGKYFKATNSYGVSRDCNPWWIYFKVTKITKEDIYDTRGNGPACNFTGISFETTCDDRINLNLDLRGYLHSIGEEITEEEFNKAWNKMVDKLNAL